MSFALTHRPAASLPTSFVPMHTEELFEAWLVGKDAKTVRAYRADVGTFAAYLAAHGSEVAPTLDAFLALDAASAHILASRFVAWSKDAGLASSTINRRLAAIRSVVAFARMVGRTTWTLAVKGVPTTAYRDTRGPGAANVRLLLSTIELGATAKARRDFALVRCLFDLALRRAEVVGLDLAHFDRETGRLSILGKKRHDREWLTLPTPTRAALEAWLDVRGANAGPLFPNFDRAGKGGRLTGRSVARIVATHGESAGIGRVRPHALRHAAITHALDVTGGDVRRVARYSRHRDLRTLTVYDDNRTDLAGSVASLVAA